MEEKNQHEGISLVDIIRLLFKKLWLLIIVTIIGGVLGGMYAIRKTEDINYFGTKVEFYVNPEKTKDGTTVVGNSQYGIYGAYGSHIMDTMTKRLNSDVFAEFLLLDGKELPEKDTWASGEANDALNAAIDTASTFVIQKQEAQEAADAAILTQTQKKTEYDRLHQIINAEWSKLVMLGLTESTTFDAVEYRENLIGQSSVLDDTIVLWTEIRAELTEAQSNVYNANTALSAAERAAEGPVNTVLSLWRQTDRYKSQLSRIKGATDFTFMEANVKVDDVNMLARSFIYANISVLNNQEYANDVLRRLLVGVPAFVEKYMFVPEGYDTTNCVLNTTVNDIHLTNPGYTTSVAMKYAVLLGGVFFAITCFILILLDRADKRLRDYEALAARINVPVLGVIPSIPLSDAKHNARGQAEEHAEKTTRIPSSQDNVEKEGE